MPRMVLIMVEATHTLKIVEFVMLTFMIGPDI